ncbi:MAG: riboflavin synthase [Deltaproteobacteria bacterium]|nr:riboflavin synthase [Deltaproteobacteria bacterium]
MFTGIVDHTGIIREINRSTRGIEWQIESQFEGLSLGESIAVDGVCLTVTAFDGGTFSVEISPETESLTTVATYSVGGEVNLERAMKATDRFGGHWVSGHVEQVSVVKTIKSHAEFKEIWFSEVSSSRSSYITPKGSITVNGVSLTINQVGEQSFSVMLIPHTLERTNLSRLTEGSQVNIECDWMAKMVVSEVRQILKNLPKSSLNPLFEGSDL